MDIKWFFWHVINLKGNKTFFLLIKEMIKIIQLFLLYTLYKEKITKFIKYYGSNSESFN